MSCDCERGTDCSVCYQLSVEYCPTLISVPCNLTPNDEYNLWIEDKFGHLYMTDTAVQGDGSILINVADYPEGLFTNESGSITMFLTISNSPIYYVTMNFAKPTNCVCITVSDPVYLTDECGNYLTDQNVNYLIQ